MTVSNIIPVNNYVGNGTNKRFDFDFIIENSDELQVTHISSDGIRTVLTNDLDYSIDVITDGGGNFQSYGSTITFPIETSSYGTLSSNEEISLALTLEIEQQKEISNSNKLNLSTLEWCLDYLTRLIQILSRKTDRAVKVQESTNINIDTLVDNVEKIAKNETNINSVASNVSTINTVASSITNIDSVALDLTNINSVASDLTNINSASTYANNASIWAEGSDDEVQALGGVHSAKTWAYDTTGANKDLSNLSATGEGHFTKTDLSNLSQTGQAVIDNKADVGLTNVSNSGKSKGSEWSMPSAICDVLTLGASGTTYTAPANGWFCLNKQAQTDGKYAVMETQTANGITSYYSTGNGYVGQYKQAHLIFPVLKGSVVKITYDLDGTTYNFSFVYAKGSESEAQ